MLRFCDSFDHYGTNDLALKWSLIYANSGSYTITSGGRTNNCLTLATLYGSNNSVTKVLDNQSTWTIGVAINWTRTAYPVEFIRLLDGTTRQISLVISATGTLYIDKNGTNIAASTNTWVNGWNYVEFQAVFNGSSGSITVRVNGGSWLTYSGNISQSGNNQANAIGFGDNFTLNFSRGNLLLDDLYICDGQGSHNTTFLGDITVDALTPNANGYYTNWTAVGSTFAYNCVNENPTDGDTTYILDNNVGDRESFTFTGPTNTILTVYGLQVVADMKKSGSGNRSIGVFTRISSTNYDNSGIAINTSYAMYTQIIELNPNTTAAWISTDIASLEAGIKVTL